MNLSPQNAATVLVHGEWADGSNWRHVVLPLRRQGFQMIVAQFPLTSLADDVTAPKRALERTEDPVVVLGHADAGAVIAAARDPLSIIPFMSNGWAASVGRMRTVFWMYSSGRTLQRTSTTCASFARGSTGANPSRLQ